MKNMEKLITLGFKISATGLIIAVAALCALYLIYGNYPPKNVVWFASISIGVVISSTLVGLAAALCAIWSW